MADMFAPLNYNHLLYFLAVVEEGGLVPAAERLGVSHPTVSGQLRKLQAFLAVDLFERRGRRLRLTETGEMVHAYARELFGLGAELIDALDARKSGRDVLGRVGIDSVLAKLLVRRALSPVLDELG
jgi:LysR family transcriptional activator of nhaA